MPYKTIRPVSAVRGSSIADIRNQPVQGHPRRNRILNSTYGVQPVVTPPVVTVLTGQAMGFLDLTYN